MAKGYPDWSTNLPADMNWSTEGEKTNIVLNQVMAETPALTSGYYRIAVIITGAGAATGWRLKFWDDSLGAYAWSQELFMASVTTLIFELPGPISMGAGDLFRILSWGNYAGNFQCSIGWARCI